MSEFNIQAPFSPSGDQPQAIASLVQGLKDGLREQVMLGVTGSGKTFTMANVIQQVQRPTLIIAHNKTLAAQLCGEFKEFFPDSAVEFFVSYYDYYQPEAYIPSSDLYIEKVSAINDEIDKLRHSATSALQERRDVVIVASVSCIYALGDPVEYLNMSISLRTGMQRDRDEVLRKLLDIQYTRNDIEFERGNFRVRGDVLEIFPANTLDKAVRVEFFGDEIQEIAEIDPTTGNVVATRDHIAIFPASHYATSRDKLKDAMANIEYDLQLQLKHFRDQGKELEAQRLEQRTRYDMEMLTELGYCSGIENYSRYFDGRQPGQPPYTLLDYFPEDFLLFIDESHQTIPQIRAMFAGDLSRKTMLVDYGFRIPSAFDNRPLKFEEFERRVCQAIYVSATPGPYEMQHQSNIAEQLIRPTGLMEPTIEVRPVTGQVDDLLEQIRQETAKGYRVLVTTLTKRMAERLTQYYQQAGVRVRYMHSDIDTMERMEIVRDLRLGEFDVLVGINLLREGLDLPEVSLVAILDADKEGFLRSATSLIQTVGRAARNVDGHVILYADTVTNSMRQTIDETQRRRTIQAAYNQEHGIRPQSVHKKVRDILEISRASRAKGKGEELSQTAKAAKIALLQQQMRDAAAELDFETAAKLRDELFALQGKTAAKEQGQRVAAAKAAAKARAKKREKRRE